MSEKVKLWQYMIQVIAAFMCGYRLGYIRLLTDIWSDILMLIALVAFGIVTVLLWRARFQERKQLK